MRIAVIGEQIAQSYRGFAFRFEEYEFGGARVFARDVAVNVGKFEPYVSGRVKRTFEPVSEDTAAPASAKVSPVSSEDVYTVSVRG